IGASRLQAGVKLTQEGASDAASLAGRIDVDPLELWLGSRAVVVEVADDAPVLVRHQELRVARTHAGRDRLGERLDGVGLGDHRCGGLGPNDRVVYSWDRDAADRGDPRRVTYLSCSDREHVRRP